LLLQEERNTKARFLVVGDGELREDLEAKTQELALRDRVIFTGWIKDLRPLYADLDVLAVTSNNEGTPVAVIEAMAAGVPVVAMDLGSCREVISNGETGFLVNSVEEAVKAIKKIPKISRKACRQRVEKKFSLEIMVENYEKVYNEIFKREEKKSQ
jgi:glycosyltransferase involved in cell wall biosynthesis